MTLHSAPDLDDAFRDEVALLRDALADVITPSLHRDLSVAALRAGRSRVRRRRLGGLAVGAGLSCVAALGLPPVVTRLDGRGATQAADEVWADPASTLGELLARVDRGVQVSGGTASTVRAREDGSAAGDVVDWTVTWTPKDGIWTLRGEGLPPAERHLDVRPAGGRLVLRAVGGDRETSNLGTVDLRGPVTAVAVRLGGGEGWVGLVVVTAPLDASVVAQMRLRGVDTWISAGELASDDRLDWSELSVEAAEAVEAVEGSGHRLAAFRLSGASEANPFDRFSVNIADGDTLYADGSRSAATLPEVTYTEAEPVVLVER